MAASGLSASTQSSRARPPALVSPGDAAIDDLDIMPARLERGGELRLEPFLMRQAVPGGEAVAQGKEADGSGEGGHDREGDE